MRLTKQTFALAALFLLLQPLAAHAQFGPGGPPSVGVAKAERRGVTEKNEYVGRVQATDRVDIVARVTAFIQERLFTEGGEVQKGDLLYRLERGPFEADLAARQAAVAQTMALLRNATITLNRAQSLLGTPAGQRSIVDDAAAQQASQAAQLQAAQAQVRSSQINLDYTEIHAPITGKIGRTTLTIGNVVSPTSGSLVTIVSQDPMYVLFPVSVREVLSLRSRYAGKGGLEAQNVRLRLADGSLYKQVGKIDYADPTVSANTDTLTLRARMPNPVRGDSKPGEIVSRDLVDGEFVTAILEGAEPVEALVIPRVAILQDQQGSYVFVVDAQKKVQQRRVKLGQSSSETAVVLDGLSEGEMVVVDGLQRVRPGIEVNPVPVGGGPPAGAPAPTAKS